MTKTEIKTLEKAILLQAEITKKIQEDAPSLHEMIKLQKKILYRIESVGLLFAVASILILFKWYV
ncbi:MAG: hypothetical protein GQ570_11635 [Helicobacteraceae bacterium]|nr:hypothetical protein [Helicobacteraceae bacterium]